MAQAPCSPASLEPTDVAGREYSLVAADEHEPDDLPATLLPGQLVAGRYEIKRLLGKGGNGAVYEGVHAMVGHRVAIKVIHRALAEREEVLARFRREAKIC